MSCPFGHGGAPHADVETSEGVAKDFGEASGGSGKPSVGSEGYSDLFAEETQRRNLMKVKVRPPSTASCGTDREMLSHACVTAVFHSLAAHHQRNTHCFTSQSIGDRTCDTRPARCLFLLFLGAALHCVVRDDFNHHQRSASTQHVPAPCRARTHTSAQSEARARTYARTRSLPLMCSHCSVRGRACRFPTVSPLSAITTTSRSTVCCRCKRRAQLTTATRRTMSPSSSAFTRSTSCGSSRHCTRLTRCATHKR